MKQATLLKQQEVWLKHQKNPNTDIRHFLSLLFVNKVLSIRFKAPIRFHLRFIYLVLVFIKIFAFIFYLFSQYTSLWQRAFGAPRGLAPMARYYNSQLRSLLRSLHTRRAFGTPKDNGVDASIDIFLVASLEYHLMQNSTQVSCKKFQK